METVRVADNSLNVAAIAMVEFKRGHLMADAVVVHFIGGGTATFDPDDSRDLLVRFRLVDRLERPGAPQG